MKGFFIAIFFAAFFARAETFDPKKMSFMELFSQSQRAGDTAEHAEWRDLANKELIARGPESLSNLMDRIHVENVMIGVYAIQLVKTWPLPKDQAVPVLLSFVGSPREVTRKMAVFLLSFYHAPEEAEKIYPLLESEKTRGAAIRALGKWRVTNALPRIEPFLHDEKERVRIVTANALRDIGDPREIPALIATLADPVFTVRNTSARALVTFGASAIGPIAGALRDASEGVAKRQLIRCLGDLKDTRALASLRPLLDSGDYETRSDVQHSCDLITGKRADLWFGPGED